MSRQARLTLPSCLASSSSPTFVRMIFCAVVIASISSCPLGGSGHRGHSPMTVRFDPNFFNQLDLVENQNAVAIDKTEVDRPTRARAAETAIKRARKEHVNRTDKYRFALRLENP